MAELKREYVVPLRRKTRLAPKWRRSKKAIAVLKDFMRQHMKCEDIVVGQELNESIWVRGIKNPPGKVAVVAIKTQINGFDKVIVDLTQEGVDNQLALYQSAMPVAAAAEEATEEVKDAEVTEVAEEKASEEPAKADSKKEVKAEAKKDE